jgi:hypothetical protein
MLSVVMLNDVFSYCYAECHYAECPYAECRYDACRYAECRYDECGATSQTFETHLQNFTYFRALTYHTEL